MAGGDVGGGQAADVEALSEAKFAGIISLVADAVIVVDDEQRIVIFNEGAHQVFGYAPAEVTGRHLDMLLPVRVRETHRRHLLNFRGGSISVKRMARRRPGISGLKKNGEEFPAEIAVSRIDVNGATFFMVVLRDATGRSRLEAEQSFLCEVGAVLASTLGYEETLASVAQLAVRSLAHCCIVDLLTDDGQLRRLQVAHVDPAKAALAEALRRVSVDREHPHFAASVLETGEPTLVSDVASGYIDSISRDEDEFRTLRDLNPVSFMALPLRAHGRLLGVLVLVSSDPHRRYAADDLRHADELARRAALAVENALLYRAAQEAIRARDEVLRIVAHDLRNPLSAIKINALLLERRLSQITDGDPAHGAIDAILRSSGRANRLIEDLLDVCRIETGRFVLEAERQLASAVLEEVVLSQSAIASASSIDLRLAATVADKSTLVLADKDRLLEVFENLIGNAFKFTPAGGWVEIGAEPNGRHAVFWVADNGSGIACEHLPDLFNRSRITAKADRRSVGLGLSICKGIVEAHGGRIWVESRPGAGSTFYFTIPTASPAPRQPEANDFAGASAASPR